MGKNDFELDTGIIYGVKNQLRGKLVQNLWIESKKSGPEVERPRVEMETN